MVWLYVWFRVPTRKPAQVAVHENHHRPKQGVLAADTMDAGGHIRRRKIRESCQDMKLLTINDIRHHTLRSTGHQFSVIVYIRVRKNENKLVFRPPKL